MMTGCLRASENPSQTSCRGLDTHAVPRMAKFFPGAGHAVVAAAVQTVHRAMDNFTIALGLSIPGERDPGSNSKAGDLI